MTQVLAVEEKKDEKEIYYPLKGEVATLGELQAGVDGAVELIHLPKRNQLMIVNEDGRNSIFPVNYLASRIYYQNGGKCAIYGNVLICDAEELE